MKNKILKFTFENVHLLIISLFCFLLTYVSSFVKAYGYFIDEFYYIACASRPAFGYVDHPPLAPFILTIFQFLFGSSIVAIRILPALATAASIFMTGKIAEEIGGQKFSQTLAACAFAASPMVIAFSGFYSMNAYEPLFAITLILYVIKMIKNDNQRLWLQAGIIMGLGVMNKHTFILFILALIVALIVSGKWRLIVNKWFFLGGVIAFIIFLPNIIWQVMNGYPSLEFYRNISESKNVYTPPVAFIIGQIINMSPTLVPIWVAGMLYLLFSKKVRAFSFLSILFIELFLFMMFTGTSRADRMIFAYPAVLAGGGLFYEAFFLRYHLNWLKGVTIVFTFVGLVLALPLVLPYFNYEFVGSYTKALGINTEMEKGKKPPLPQILADRIGWEEKFSLVLQAYNSLSETEKHETIIAGGNYGQAGAMELFGKNHNFPLVGTGHNNYYLWSKGHINGGKILLQLDNVWNLDSYKRLFGSVTQFPGEFTNKYVSSHENHLVVFICREPKIPFETMLDMSKNYH